SGNILGEQQSGHIKEIGIELYQDMLEETISLLKDNKAQFVNEKWSPKINLDLPILIPSDYLEDVNIRMEIYRKLSNLNDISDLEFFEVELVDRFGSFPSEVAILLRVISIKIRCKNLNIESIKKSKNGFIVQFKNNIFKNPEALLNYIVQSEDINIKPDEKLSFEGQSDNEILNYVDQKLDDIELLHKLN
ncbi:MAG: TRCF domain-containing protein, partial [Pseudomonadota bacterium]|nr:TRCF domain-containing protein [Pseudomonadota bacterium]